MSQNTKAPAQAKIPDRLFLYGELVDELGVIQAAILSDLYFWFVKGEQPWRTYQNWSDWLGVSTKTIARQVERLVNSTEAINRKRTILSSGGKGAYKFSLSNTKKSKYIFQLYSELASNKHSTNDLGSIDGESISSPNYQMVYVNSIGKFGGLELAYVVNCLAWNSANCIDNYSSISYLAERLNLNRTSLKRYLNGLNDLGLLSLNSDGRRVFVTLEGEANQVAKDFFEWNEAIREERMTIANS